MPAHAIVRLGKLEAGPAQGGRVTLSPGDDFDAKTSLTAAAQAVAEVLARPEAVNASLSVTQPARQRGARVSSSNAGGGSSNSNTRARR